MSQLRETAMRVAFTAAARSVIESTKPVKQPRLVKCVVRKLEQGSGLYRPARGR
jgi:hypothetical protein